MCIFGIPEFEEQTGGTQSDNELKWSSVLMTFIPEQRSVTGSKCGHHGKQCPQCTSWYLLWLLLSIYFPWGKKPSAFLFHLACAAEINNKVVQVPDGRK